MVKQQLQNLIDKGWITERASVDKDKMSVTNELWFTTMIGWKFAHNPQPKLIENKPIAELNIDELLEMGGRIGREIAMARMGV